MKSRTVSMSDPSGALRLLGDFFQFSIHEHLPNVVQLAVHLQKGQRVYFTEETVPDVARRTPPPQKKKKKKKKKKKNYSFRIFSALSREHPSFAFTLLYIDFPRFYTRDTSSKSWERRKRGKRLNEMTYRKLKRLAELIQ